MKLLRVSRPLKLKNTSYLWPWVDEDDEDPSENSERTTIISYVMMTLHPCSILCIYVLFLLICLCIPISSETQFPPDIISYECWFHKFVSSFYKTKCTSRRSIVQLSQVFPSGTLWGVRKDQTKSTHEPSILTQAYINAAN